jgi:hypothetical protein
MSKSKKKPAQKSGIRRASSRTSRQSPRSHPRQQASPPNLAAQLLYGLEGKSYQLVNPRTQAIERVVDRLEMESELKLRHDELQAQYAQALKAWKKISVWAKRGFFGADVGCSVAFRKKFGRVISPLRYGIEVHVPFKLSSRKLVAWPEVAPSKRLPFQQRYAVPPLVDSVLTKVVETRLYRTHATHLAGTSALQSGMVRVKATGQLVDISSSDAPALAETEIIGGLPTVESNKDNWGTLGIAIQTGADSQVLGLVNSHFADGSMVQPPQKPRARDISVWDIGFVLPEKRLEGHVPGIQRGEKFYVDAALIWLNQKRSTVVNLVQDFADESFLFAGSHLRFWHAGSDRSDAFKKVYKFGARTQERIEGYIENPMDTVPYYGQQIQNVIRARRNGSGTFTLAGDSGSALVAPIFDPVTGGERFLVVGLCFAGVEGDKETLYACQFAAVIQALEIELPSSLLRIDWKYDNTQYLSGTQPGNAGGSLVKRDVRKARK